MVFGSSKSGTFFAFGYFPHIFSVSSADTSNCDKGAMLVIAENVTDGFD
jgi:hypothetical protein